MADTKAATEARKVKAELTKKFGAYVESGADIEVSYKQWCKSLFGEDEPDDELLMFALSQAKIAGIDLRVAGQMYVQDGNVITNIEGLVTIAEKTGQYGGTTRPEYEEGKTEADGIISCTIGVYKIIGDHVLTSEQTVYFEEYDTGEGMWRPASEGGKPRTMIKKVALAHAIRASFSTCNGMYVPEEVEKKKAAGGSEAAKKKTRAKMETNIENALKAHKKKGTSPVKTTKAKAVKAKK